MSELMKWGGGGELNRRDTKKLRGDLGAIVQDGLKAKAEMEVSKHLYLDAMECVADVDHYRQVLAAGNPELNAVLVRFELGFAAEAERIIRGRNSPLKKMGY